MTSPLSLTTTCYLLSLLSLGVLHLCQSTAHPICVLSDYATMRRSSCIMCRSIVQLLSASLPFYVSAASNHDILSALSTIIRSLLRRYKCAFPSFPSLPLLTFQLIRSGPATPSHSQRAVICGDICHLSPKPSRCANQAMTRPTASRSAAPTSARSTCNHYSTNTKWT